MIVCRIYIYIFTPNQCFSNIFNGSANYYFVQTYLYRLIMMFYIYNLDHIVDKSNTSLENVEF